MNYLHPDLFILFDKARAFITICTKSSKKGVIYETLMLVSGAGTVITALPQTPS